MTDTLTIETAHDRRMDRLVTCDECRRRALYGWHNDPGVPQPSASYEVTEEMGYEDGHAMYRGYDANQRRADLGRIPLCIAWPIGS